MTRAIDSPIRTDRHRAGRTFLLDSLTRLSGRWKRPLSPKGQSHVERDVGGQMNVSCTVKREVHAVAASCAGSSGHGSAGVEPLALVRQGTEQMFGVLAGYLHSLQTTWLLSAEGL